MCRVQLERDFRHDFSKVSQKKMPRTVGCAFTSSFRYREVEYPDLEVLGMVDVRFAKPAVTKYASSFRDVAPCIGE